MQLICPFRCGQYLQCWQLWRLYFGVSMEFHPATANFAAMTFARRKIGALNVEMSAHVQKMKLNKPNSLNVPVAVKQPSY